MSEMTPEQKLEMLPHLKVAHDQHATIVHMLKTRFQFYAEEFMGVQTLINFYTQLRDDLLKKIEEIEPPAAPQKKSPMTIDLPTKPDLKVVE